MMNVVWPRLMTTKQHNVSPYPTILSQTTPYTHHVATHALKSHMYTLNMYSKLSCRHNIILKIGDHTVLNGQHLYMYPFQLNVTWAGMGLN